MNLTTWAFLTRSILHPPRHWTPNSELILVVRQQVPMNLSLFGKNETLGTIHAPYNKIWRVTPGSSLLTSRKSLYIPNRMYWYSGCDDTFLPTGAKSLSRSVGGRKWSRTEQFSVQNTACGGTQGFKVSFAKSGDYLLYGFSQINPSRTPMFVGSSSVGLSAPQEK